MKNIFLTLMMLLSINAYGVNLEICSNQDADASEIISDDYIFCLNRNFVKMRNYLDVDRYTIPRCRNMDYSMIDMRFIDCINDNIQKIGQMMQMKFGYCPNYSTEQLQTVFINCVNGKFERLNTRINQ